MVLSGFLALASLPWGLSDPTAAQSLPALLSVPIPYIDAAPVFTSLRDDRWPVEFRGVDADQRSALWPTWVARRDAAIRQRLAEGDEDSVGHYLLYGTSFTTRPRASAGDVAALVGNPGEALRRLRPRIQDLVAAISGPRQDEHLQFVRQVVGRRGLGTSSGSRAALLRYLESLVAAVGKTTSRTSRLLDASDPTDALTMFRDRGLSSDSSLFVQFGLERVFEAMTTSQRLEPRSVRRVALVGPGLDFTDKFEGYDFYPPQTIQPFAIVDTLGRVGLAAPDLQVVAFDLSSRVLGHIAAARSRAEQGATYRVVLPRSLERPWEPDVISYWKRFGDRIGEAVAGGTSVPSNAGRVEVRSVDVSAAVASRVTGHDLNIVLQRVGPNGPPPFDIIVATNVLLYYDLFEQALAVANVAAMLSPDGLFITNNRLLDLPDSPLEPVAEVGVSYVSLPGVGKTGDAFTVHRKRR